MVEKDLILKYALQNAIFYSGKANPRAVLGKVLASEPELRRDAKGLEKDVEEIVEEINRLPLEEQRQRLEELAPKMMVKEVKEQKKLPDLPGAKPGGVVTRFAPSPTGPLSLPHLLRAAFLSYLYAKRYQGRFILRFEDTDPGKIRKEFFGYIKKDLQDCGIEWDQAVMQSDYMEQYYIYAEKLIREGKAYTCSCTPKAFQKLKRKKQNCPGRKMAAAEHLRKWQGMLEGKYGEGTAVVRLKTSMKEPNPAMRDPPLLRISEAEHPLKGRRYRVWPLYNFACVIDDHVLGVTHVFRGKEHENNTHVQEKLYRALGWKSPVVTNFGMIRLPGEKLHTRDIKEMVREGEVEGWDDIRLPTIRALLRRGFSPKAFRACALGCGLTKTDIIFNWESLEKENRRVQDRDASRYMAVLKPVKLSVKGSHHDLRKVSQPLHPGQPGKGKKEIPVSLDSVYISGDDHERFQGREIRLKGLGNVRLEGERAEYTGNAVEREMQKIQWVSEPHIKLEIVKPDKVLEGIAEPALKKARKGEVIQLERIGFGRVDDKKKDTVIVWFAHK